MFVSVKELNNWAFKTHFAKLRGIQLNREQGRELVCYSTFVPTAFFTVQEVYGDMSTA